MPFVVIEGPNGSGKTSLINEFKKRTKFNILQNPGSTELGKLLRPICRGEEQWNSLHDSVRSLLFSAVRNDLYDNVVKDTNQLHLVDRWWMSTYVYQICFANLPLQNLESTIYPNEKIDLVILLNAHDNILIDRVAKERNINKNHSHDLWTHCDTIKKISKFYNVDLPVYLTEKNIPFINLCTNVIDIEKMFNIAILYLHRYSLISS